MGREYIKDGQEEKKEVKENIGDIGTITQDAGYYVVAEEGRIPCASIAEAKILSILLQSSKQK